MAHTLSYNNTFTGNSDPTTTGTFNITSSGTVIVIVIGTEGSSNRAGGNPTFTDSNSDTPTLTLGAQHGAGYTEATHEIFYYVGDIPSGNSSISVPNTNIADLWINVSVYDSSTGASEYGNSGSTFADGANHTYSVVGSIDSVSVVNFISDYRNVATAPTQTSLGTYDWGQRVAACSYSLHDTASEQHRWTQASERWSAVYSYFDELVDNTATGAETATINEAQTGTATRADSTLETATINDAPTAVKVFSATCAETATIGEVQTAAEPTDVISKSQIFSVPTSAGTASFNISGWTDTPKAAAFILIGTDGTDSYDDHSILGFGISDGTNDYATNIYAQNGVDTSVTHRSSDGYVVHNTSVGAGTADVTAAFSQWESGGVELTWAGAGLSGNNYQVLVEFFAGDNLEAAAITPSPGDHVESLSFTSKLIIGTTIGRAAVTSDTTTAIVGIGVCTNGTGGVTQHALMHSNYNNYSTATHWQGIRNDSNMVYGSSTFEWQTAISSIDSVGFNISGSDTDIMMLLCLGGFTGDVDSGVTTVPTSGNIAITDPGFYPQMVSIMGTTNTSVNALTDDIQYQGIHIGVFDGTRENSVNFIGEDGATTMNQTSVHSSEILHVEDPDQSTLFESSAITFDGDGFDITVSTHPGTATYFGWWAIEGEEPTNAASTSETATIDEAQTVQQNLNDSGSESATIDEAQTAIQVFSVTCTETATIDDAPSTNEIFDDSCSESVSIDDAPRLIGRTQVRAARFMVPTTTGNHDFDISGWDEVPTAAIVRVFGARGAGSTSSADIVLGVGFTDGTNEYCCSVVSENNVATSNSAREVQSSFVSRVTASPSNENLYKGDFVQWNSGGIRLNFSGTVAGNGESIVITFLSGVTVQAHVGYYSPGDHVEDVGFTSKLIFVASVGITGTYASSNLIFSQGVVSNGSNGLTQFWAGLHWRDGVATSEGNAYFGSAGVAGFLFAGSKSWETAVSNIDSSGFNLSGSDADDIAMLCLTFDEDVDCGYTTVPTSGDISVTDPGWPPQHVELFPSSLTALDTLDSTTLQMFIGTSFGGVDGFEHSGVGIGLDNTASAPMKTSYSDWKILFAYESVEGYSFLSSSYAITATGFDIGMAIRPTTAVYMGWWAIQNLDRIGSESASITEAQVVTQATYNVSCSESATINDTPTSSQTSAVAGSETVNINEAQTGEAEEEETVAETATIDDTPTVQANVSDSTAETATISETQDAVKVLADAGSESATINEDQDATAAVNESVAETATINEVQTGEEVNEASISETANINEAQSATGTWNDTTAETATINEAPAASQTQTAAGSESATIGEEQTGALGEQSATIEETATISETQTAVQERADSTSESASINEDPTVQANVSDATAETATIDEAQTTQVDFSASDSETTNINEQQSATGAGDEEMLESASIDEAPTVQANLNDTGNESASIDEAPAASLTQADAGSETATIDEVETAQANLQAVTSETATINDAPAAQASLNDSDSETVNINEQQSATEDNEGLVEESASIDEAPTVQANVSDTGTDTATIDEVQTASNVLTATISESATIGEEQTGTTAAAEDTSESATIDEVQTAQATLNATTSESLNINELTTAEGDRDGVLVESTSIDESQTTQVELNDADAESASIDDSPDAIRTLVAAVLETATIDDTPDSDIAEIAANAADTATIDDTQTAQATFYADITESLAVTAAESGLDLDNLFNDVYITGVVRSATISGVVRSKTISGEVRSVTMTVDI